MYIKKILLIIALLGLLAFGYFAYFVYKTMFIPNTSFTDEQVFIHIPTNATYSEVRYDLSPLLKNMETFDALAKQKKYISNIKPGRFLIKNGMTNNDIINSIRSKNKPLKLSFNNQNTLEQLAQRISQQIEADSLSLISAFNEDEFIKKNEFTLQTALAMYLPNSYEFYWNTSAQSFRDRMLKEYNSFWNENRLEKANTLGLNPLEVMILAAIVHEETKQKAEQPIVAGVYINRLKKDWPLQADPTIKYAAYQQAEYKNTIIKRVLNIHKTIDSPYNTYIHIGLPPGLIAMPDISAIHAVLNYKEHNYYYFVADVQKPGFHKFSKTLAQHNLYARKYQRYLSNKGIMK